MHLLLRLLLVLFRVRRHAGEMRDPLAEAQLAFRVLPTDLDLNRHMNNARYLSLMDLGRVDLLGRLGFLRFAFRGHWTPVVGAVRIRYHRPLHLFERFHLATRFVGWDERWFYLEQRFTRAGQPVAIAQIKALLRGPAGNLPTATVLTDIGITTPSPPLPDTIRFLPD